MTTTQQLAAQQSYSQFGTLQDTLEYQEMIRLWELEEEAAEATERAFWDNHNASDHERAEAAYDAQYGDGPEPDYYKMDDEQLAAYALAHPPVHTCYQKPEEWDELPF